VKIVLVSLLSLFIFQAGAKDCTSLNRVPLCHKGINSNSGKHVQICVDFGSLWAHIPHHPDDYISENCGEDFNLEEDIEVYACNAGLRHKDHNDGLCFDMNQGGAIVPNCSLSSNCICSGENLPQVLNSFDYMSYEIGQMSTSQVSYSSEQKTAGRQSYNQATTSQGYSVLNPEKGVSFFLGSERFGSEYFVDLCWNILNPALENFRLKATVSTQVTENTFGSNGGYLDYAGLLHRAGVFCDTNDSGPLNFSSTPHYMTNESSFQPALNQFSYTFEEKRACFARLLFKETQNEVLRPWDLKKIVVDSILDIEPVDEIVSEPIDGPFTYCQVNRIRGNNFSCTQHSFPDTQSFRNYMLNNYGGNGDWTQDNNTNYRGLCRADCRPLRGNEANQ